MGEVPGHDAGARAYRVVPWRTSNVGRRNRIVRAAIRAFAAAWLFIPVVAASQAANPGPTQPVIEMASPSKGMEALGQRLFLDAALSADGLTSCATCHQPERAFTDGKAVAEGAAGRRATRNTPSLLDVTSRPSLTWEGRETRLELQVLRPFTQSREHGLKDTAQLLRMIRSDPEYRRQFAATFGGSDIQLADIGTTLSAYLRTLKSGTSPYDAFQAGNVGALSESARRGDALFRGAAGCAECHRIDRGRASFTDEDFHRVGVGLPAIAGRLPELTARVSGKSAAEVDALVFEDGDIAALGRFLVTRNPKDIGAYRTPSLRNVAVTPPYMHDGSVATLPEAVSLEVYYRLQNRGRSNGIGPMDQADLVEFLKALTD